jgi:hypothetical protein
MTTVSITLSQVTLAYYPEYGHLTPQEQEEINAPRLIGSEYESDRLTYQFLSSWHGDFMANEESFQYTAGSLGPTRFFTQGRMRFRKSLNKTFDFQLAYMSEGSLRLNRQSLIFEFFYKPTSWLHLSLYGEPSTLKKQDDIGVASTFLFSAQSQLRLFYTWVDFSHNKRNEAPDRYDSLPASAGAVWRWYQRDSYLQSSLRHDFHTKRAYSSGRIYQFGRTEAQILSRHALSPGRETFLQTEFNYSRGFEADTQNRDGSIDRWENEAVDGLMQLQFPAAFFRLVGLRILYSQWDSDQGRVIHNDILPHLWVAAWEGASAGTPNHFDLGYEFTWHRGQGPMSLRSTLDERDKLEHRMNARYRYETSEGTSFNVLLTFDLDEFGGGETWEGGAMQFATRF